MSDRQLDWEGKINQKQQNANQKAAVTNRAKQRNEPAAIKPAGKPKK